MNNQNRRRANRTLRTLIPDRVSPPETFFTQIPQQRARSPPGLPPPHLIHGRSPDGLPPRLQRQRTPDLERMELNTPPRERPLTPDLPPHLRRERTLHLPRVRLLAPQRLDLTPPPQPDAYHIHRESSKINYRKLIDFLFEKTGMFPPDGINYSQYINENMSSIINLSDEAEEEKMQQINGLQRIMNERLNNINYREISPLIQNSIFYTIEYVKLQPAEFKKIYLQTFVSECVTAYGPNSMTCANGALERIIMSLVTPCQSLLSNGRENMDYETIIAIIVANPEKMIPEYIRDWYKIHKTGTSEAFPQGTTVEEKRADLKRYLLEKFPENEELIDAKIIEIADNIGYDDDDFMYGGLKRRPKNFTIKKRRTKTKKYIAKKNVTKKHHKKATKAKRTKK
jgi:hypothetical protein